MTLIFLCPKQGWPKPVLLHKLNFGNAGAWVVRFGDLNGDGEVDLLTVQNRHRQPTCLTAWTLRGKKLWQQGIPNLHNATVTADLPVQIFDWNRDGKDEVLLVRHGMLQVLEGTTGALLQETPVLGYDSIFIFQPRPNEPVFWLLLKDRYQRFWVYDDTLQLRWEGAANTGHFPLALDVEGDGQNELLVGYSLFSNAGALLWKLSLPRHPDALAYGDLNGDGRPEIGIAISGDAVLITPEGKVAWRKPLRHSQHVGILTNAINTPWGKQVLFVDRARHGRVIAYNAAGKRLWSLPPQGFFSALTVVSGWSGLKKEQFAIIFRRDLGRGAIMIDGSGATVAEFPFAPAAHGGRAHHYFLQHFDALGDSREEILIYNERELWVYGNSAPQPKMITIQESLPNPRIYNATFYYGWQ